MKRSALFAALFLVALSSLAANAASISVFTAKPDDPKAVYVQDLGAKGDGKSDDSAALQAAIDKVATTRLGGTVFISSGRYRLSRTIYVWDAVRLIGYGAAAPCSCWPTTHPAFKAAWPTWCCFPAADPPL